MCSSIRKMARRRYDLREVRADGWFEGLSAQGPQFVELCQAIGERVVAFSLVAGVQIVGVHLDTRNRDGSVIEFVAVPPGVDDPDAEVQRVSLADFRRRLIATLTSYEVVPDAPAADADAEALQAFLGLRTVLLSPLYGIGLIDLHVGDGLPPTVTVRVGQAQEEVGLDELRAALRQRVQGEAQGGFSIDLQVVDEAEAAAKEGDAARVHELLGQWPGPLSMLLRSPQGQGLSPDARDRLATAMGLLGDAYGVLAVPERASECFRLAIQWAQGQGGPVLGANFVRFAQHWIEQGDPGKAVGMLRRALTLGADKADVLPRLATCYAELGRHLAALACAQTAQALGADEDATLFASSAEALGEPWARYRARVPAPSCTRPTRPPEPS